VLRRTLARLSQTPCQLLGASSGSIVRHTARNAISETSASRMAAQGLLALDRCTVGKLRAGHPLQIFGKSVSLYIHEMGDRCPFLRREIRVLG
jgi:hypothetical protein